MWGTNEENTGIIEKFACFLYGGAGAGLINRLRPKSTGSATLVLGIYKTWVTDFLNSNPGPTSTQKHDFSF